MSSNIHYVLDYYSAAVPSNTYAIDGGKEKTFARTRPIPLAVVASNPSVRMVAEWHEQAAHSNDHELVIGMAPSRQERTEQLAESSVSEGTETGTGSVSCIAREAAVLKRLRHTTVLRELRFPTNKIPASLALSAWWLTRKQSCCPLALCLENMFDDAIPLKDVSPELLTLAASVEFTTRRRFCIAALEGCFLNARELHFVGCALLDETGYAGFESIPRYVNPHLLTALNLRGSAVADLEWLPQLGELGSLNLEACEAIDSFESIGALQKLRWLNISQTECGEFTWLPRCEALAYLNVGTVVSFDSFAPVSRLAHLRTIAAEGTGVQSLAGLVNWVVEEEEESDAKDSYVDGVPPVAGSLRNLVLTESTLESIEGVERLAVLEVLDVGATLVTESTGSSGIRVLGLANTELEEHTGLPGLAKWFPFLHSLNLSQCQSLEDLTALASLRGTLRVLNLRRCDFVGVLPPELLTVLEELDITGCTGLANVEHTLAQCTELRALHAVALNSITTLQWLSHCPHVEELNFSGTDSLRSVKGLESVAGTLRYLDLSDTAVTSVLPSVPACTQLRTFVCIDCPLDKRSVAAVRAMGFRGPNDYADIDF